MAIRFVTAIIILIYLRESSFFPSTLRLWKGLSNEVRSSQTLPQLKRKVRIHEIQFMDHLLVGDRKSNFLLTRIRHRCSSLNADLLSVNIGPYSNCLCRAKFETAEHYLSECRLHYVQRQRLKNNSNPDFDLNFDLLTFCTENCNTEQNKDII